MKKIEPSVTGSGKSIEKALTGIKGLDEITGGGLPRGRSTLVCGSAGCGKTLLAMEFIIKGAIEFDEPGIFMTFEETPDDLNKNFNSLGYDLDDLVRKKKIVIDHVYIERSEIEETGEYDLEGLFVRLGSAIDSIGAKRVALDTLESLFSGLPNPLIIRAELRRLFRWLKTKGVTTVITGEQGEKTFTRHGLEEYVSDCVIFLDHRVNEQITTRRIRVVKYRGTYHGTNEYPFLIDETGITVIPITEMKLNHIASTERVSTGIPRLDSMLGGKGIFRSSTVLISGTSGTGKTSIASLIANSACERGERVLYFAFEESPNQIVRNIGSIGVDLGVWEEKGLLEFHASRPTLFGLEMHLGTMMKIVVEKEPTFVVLDPIDAFVKGDNTFDVQRMLSRFIDYLKANGITSVLTCLSKGEESENQSNVYISSMVDTWIVLTNIKNNGEHNRALHIVKSRGMGHSNQIREFVLTDRGVHLSDVYSGAGGMLMGTARLARELDDRADLVKRQKERRLMEMRLAARRQSVENQIAKLQADLKVEEIEILTLISDAKEKESSISLERKDLAISRKVDEDGSETDPLEG